MIDSYGRNIDYIRISVIDRCNLRCVYCMPEEGIEMTTREEILTYGEIITISETLAKLGITKVKITGGEPLIRKDLPKLIRGIKEIPGIEQVTITTNGVLLEKMMDSLKEAGITGINLSLDTLDQELFSKIVRRDVLHQVLKGLDKALQYPEIPLKINCVPMGMKGQDLIAIAGLAKTYPIHVRFIEMMPIGLGKTYSFQSEDEVLTQLQQIYGSAKKCQVRLGNGPSHYYSFPEFKGKIGFISAISHKFCESCNRIRLTSEGFLKTCLQYDQGSDLKRILRSGGTKPELQEAILQAICEKPMSHKFLSAQMEREETLAMSKIGG